MNHFTLLQGMSHFTLLQSMGHKKQELHGVPWTGKS